jgi:hypothetical protein
VSSAPAAFVTRRCAPESPVPHSANGLAGAVPSAASASVGHVISSAPQL